MIALLGFFLVVLIVGGPFAIGAFIYYKYGRRIENRKRERQIETMMRLGLRDTERQQNVAEKIIHERYGNNN